MSVLDKVIAAVTPPETQEARREAHAKARAAAQPGDWLSMALDHHELIESAFAAVKAAPDPAGRRAAEKHLGIVLTGHSIAEEAVLYPKLGELASKAHAGMAYDEQALAKAQMAMLEELDPTTQEYLDKLGHIEGAVLHHVYSEEGTWFLELKEKASPADEAHLTKRYEEEYSGYVGADA